MEGIDDRYLDVDFTKEPEYTFGDLGAQCFGSEPVFEDSETLIPRNQWEGLAEKLESTKTGLEWLVTRIYDQGREGACVANMFGAGIEICQAKQHGRDAVVPLSAMSLYRRIGRSPSSGSTLNDALADGGRRGMLPLDTPANRARFGEAVMPNIGWSQTFPANWEATAKLFRTHEAPVIRSFDGLVSALLKGYPVGVGRQGHSILYVGVRFRSGRIVVPYPNSWSERWGQAMGFMPGGFGFDSESQIKQSASWAIAFRSVIIPSR